MKLTGSIHNIKSASAALLLCLLTLSINVVMAQDAHLSQFYSSELTLNPALTGQFKGEHRGYLNYRAQWNSVIKKTPHETTIIAYDKPMKRFGVGGYLLNYRAGNSGINFFHFVLSGAYEISVDRQRVHHLITGLQLGFIHKGYSPTSYDIQYDTTYIPQDGAEQWFNPLIPTGESYEQLTFILPEVNFGVLYYNAKRYADVHPYGGLSAYHLTSPKETFYSAGNRLPIRMVAYGGSKIKLDKNYSIDANFIYMRQTNANELQVGGICTYDIEGSNQNFFGGVYYRNQDAVILHLGGTYEDYVIGVSYDFNTSTLRSVSKGRGGFELSIRYQKKKARYLPSIF
ncbi:MAG: PorP/SprF family type IX secretion system membrane protein [Flavobacteriales bacterium]|nr:PorP/SprF family type IX secretion system membrane protein [Flavobacteriales bacterium]